MSVHPSESDLRRFAAGKLGDTEFEQVASHLESCDQCVNILREPGVFHGPWLVPDTIDRVATNGSRKNTVVGPYKLLEELGEGGMGVVYMAEQQHPVRRNVAIKIIKPGLDTRQVIARFEAERQTLALMDHHNIARVLDAGETESGHPYFVMELVKGIPITQYCDRCKLTPRERLELFIPVCHAIQHAHQKGVIHRDIKPSNVLIALYDGRPVPKVIDFGIAKATHQKLTERTMFTGIGQILGTLEYMSPEQAEMNQLDIDTRSDVYSLGVLLYELLTGSTPITKDELRHAGLEQMLRTIREQEPPKPSTRLSDSGNALPSISEARRTVPAKLSKLIRGDLDWIAMKALDKDRNCRYQSANGLASDILKYLNDEPVEASPPSVSYQLKKFARKYRALFATAALVLAILTASTLVLSSLLVALQQESAENELKSVVQGLLDCSTTEVDRHLQLFREEGQPAIDMLDDTVEVESLPRRERLHVALALAPHDQSSVDILCRMIKTASPEEAQSIAKVFTSIKSPRVDDWLEAAINQSIATPIVRLRILAIMAQYNPGHECWSSADSLFDLTEGLEPKEAAAWLTQLTPWRSQLASEAANAFVSSDDPQRRDQATWILASREGIELRDLIAMSAIGSSQQLTQAAQRMGESGQSMASLLTAPQLPSGKVIQDGNGYVVRRDRLEDLPQVAEQMKQHGYCLSNLHCYGGDDKRFIDSIFVLTGVKWKLVWNKSPAELADSMSDPDLEQVATFRLPDSGHSNLVRTLRDRELMSSTDEAGLAVERDSIFRLGRWSNANLSSQQFGAAASKIDVQESATRIVYTAHGKRISITWNDDQKLDSSLYKSVVDQSSTGRSPPHHVTPVSLPPIDFQQLDTFTIEALVEEYTGPIFSQGLSRSPESSLLWFGVGSSITSFEGIGWESSPDHVSHRSRVGVKNASSHVAVSWNRGELAVYFNGKILNRGVVDGPTNPDSNARLLLGALDRLENDGSGPRRILYGTGDIRELRISDTPRYPADGHEVGDDVFEPPKRLKADEDALLHVQVSNDERDVQSLNISVSTPGEPSASALAIMSELGLAPLASERHADGQSNTRHVATWVPRRQLGVVDPESMAVMLLALGNNEMLLERLRSNDATQLARTIHAAGSSFPNATTLLHQIATLVESQQRDPAMYGLILALGEFSLSDLTPSEQDQASTILRQVLARRDDWASYAAASWLLGRWNQPHVETTEAATSSDNDWELTPDCRPLAIIKVADAVASALRVDVPQVTTYSLAAFETTVADIRQFFPTACPGRTRDQPATDMTLRRIAEYCNWLSERADLEPCFEFGRDAGDVIIPADYLLRSGYRLPTFEEWTYASSGWNARPVVDTPLLREYAWYGQPDRRPQEVGQLRPSRRGLFDVYGNVAELAIQRYGPMNQLATTSSGNLVLCGGTIGSDEIREVVSPRNSLPDSVVGIRLARTVEPPVTLELASGQLNARRPGSVAAYIEDVTWANEVVSVARDDTAGGVGDPAAELPRSQNALGPPYDYTLYPENFEESYYSLTFGGQVVVSFSSVATEGPGHDVVVCEVGPGYSMSDGCTVEVSWDGTDWISVGTVAASVTLIDIAPFVEEGFRFRYVRLTDDPVGASRSNPGADIDAIGVLHTTNDSD